MQNFVILPAPDVVPVCPSPTETKCGFNEELIQLKRHFLNQDFSLFSCLYAEAFLPKEKWEFL